jgi:hypothetical protein
MATYIQGVSAYVPQFQPYQPDLNFESNLMQMKQTQYDTNWKALNNVYGQYFYADLTKETNLKKKEDIMKNIEFNLQRVAGLDLSLSQNTDQAMQVFKPFYEDNYLMKDMAWTKTKNAQRGYGMSLKNETNKDKSKMYWNDGIKAIDYLTEEFKNSSDEESLQFANVAYTPFRNVMAEARQLAKDSGIQMETPSFSEDGRWMYQTKNGQQIMEPLSKLFEAELGNDPGIQDVYRTKAYVQRKDYITENAAQFKGDKTAAEMQYLQDNFNLLKGQVQQAYKTTQETSTGYDVKIRETEKAIKDGTARSGAQQYLDDLKRNKAINDQVLDRFKSQNEEYLSGESTTQVSTGFENPYGDIKSLRMKVDNGITWNKLSKDMNEAAQINAYRDYKVTQKENPYAVLAEKQAGEMAQIRLRNAGTLAAVRERNKGEEKNIDRKWRLDSGTSVLQDVTEYDEKTGEYVTRTQLVENEAAMYAHPGLGEGGNITDEMDIRKIQKHVSGKISAQYAQPYWSTTRDLLKRLSTSGAFTYEDLKRIQFGDRALKKGEKVKSLDQFMQDMATFSGNYPERMKGVKGRIDGYLEAHANLPDVSYSKADYDQKSIGFESYINYAENNADYTKKTSDLARQELLRSGFEKKYLDLAIDEKTGRLRTAEQFQKLVSQKYGEDEPILHGSGSIYDPSKGKSIEVTNKNYKAVVERIGKHMYENGTSGSTTTRFYKDGTKARQGLISALGTNEGMDAVFVDRNGKRTSIQDNKEAIQKLVKSNKSYLIKQTQAGGWFSDNAYEIREVDPTSDKEKIYNQLGNGYVFNMWTNVKRNVNNKATAKYEEIQKAIGDAYSSSEIMKLGIPTMTGTIDPGTGVYAETSAITVLPKNRQSPGTVAMIQFMNQMQTMDLDGMSSMISFNGLSKSALDGVKLSNDNADTWADFSQTAKGKFIIRSLQDAMNNPNQYKMNPFTLEYQSIAGNDIDKEAMIIRPSMEWLKQFQSTNEKLDENGQGNNALTLAEYNSMITHGLSVVAPSGTFNNSLTMGSVMSPFASNVIYKTSNGVPVSYEDSYGEGKVSITHDNQNNDFIITVADKKDKNNNTSYNVPISKGQEEYNKAIQYLDLLSQQSSNTYTGQ